MIALNNKKVCIKNCLQKGTSHKQFEGSFLYNRKVLQEKINKQNVKHKENNGKKNNKFIIICTIFKVVLYDIPCIQISKPCLKKLRKNIDHIPI